MSEQETTTEERLRQELAGPASETKSARKLNKAAIITGVVTFFVTGLIMSSGDPEIKRVEVPGPVRTETVEVVAPDEELRGHYNDALDKVVRLESQVRRLEKAEKQSPPPPAEVAVTPAEVAVTPGMENAVATARDYLNYTSFSLQGLIEQLEYEGFSTAEATYGATKAYK